jgi:hypothetical protein
VPVIEGRREGGSIASGRDGRKGHGGARRAGDPGPVGGPAIGGVAAGSAYRNSGRSHGVPSRTQNPLTCR